MAAQKNYKINIDPRILELLGPSLYTNIYYILAELIANAYDANASNVYIIQDKASIIVEDDGSGMSYSDGDIKNYLNVACETRVCGKDAYVSGSERKRKKMGRKGVGKLAALSVSEDVEIHTIKNDDKSGFILSRHVDNDHKLIPISEEHIKFQVITGDGTSIVMKNPQHLLHKTVSAVRNNLLKIFPLVDSDFRIHLSIFGKKLVIDSFEVEVIKDLGGLIILGDKFDRLKENFNSGIKFIDQVNDKLLLCSNDHTKKLSLKNKDGITTDYEISISGWAGVYRSTRNKKTDPSDFPDNFISLLSNRKLGEYNILPIVGKNSLYEVYIVGQLHVDMLEETTLPDIALSNRQGYKYDDPRYQEVIRYVRGELLPRLIALRANYATYSKMERDANRHEKDRSREALLKEQISKFKINASNSAAKKIKISIDQGENSQDFIENAVKNAINTNFPDMGIKKSVDNSKKKLLISHSSEDKKVSDFVYDLLVFNGVLSSSIIYTSTENSDSRIPQKTDIFDYLREFFVESYSTEKIYVL